MMNNNHASRVARFFLAFRKLKECLHEQTCTAGVYLITTYMNQNREPILRSPLPTLRLISV